MKKTLIAVLMIVFSFTQHSFAGSATPDECIAKGRQAALMIRQKGLIRRLKRSIKETGSLYGKTAMFL